MIERREPGRAGAVFIGVALFVLSVSADFYYSRPGERIAVVLISLWLSMLIAVGALVLLRQPGHRVGALLMATAVLLSFANLTKGYAWISLLQDGGFGGGEVSAWLSAWIVLPGFACFALALLHFPNGRVPSERWRHVPVVVVAMFAVAVVRAALRPGQIDGLPGVDNPVAPSWGDTVANILVAFEFGVILAVLVVIASLFVRLRSASTTERQQVKWLVYSVGAFPLVFLMSQIVQTFDPSSDEYAGFLIIMVGLFAIPAAIGVGILKYRLYDIDVVINRTLVYGLLTGILAGGYLGMVALLQLALEPFTPQSDISIVISTLSVAAVFRPLRRRVQSFIDRRFYRNRYDSAATLENFAARLRDEIDLGSLSTELVTVVGQTMQPQHASLWLMEGGS